MYKKSLIRKKLYLKGVFNIHVHHDYGMQKVEMVLVSITRVWRDNLFCCFSLTISFLSKGETITPLLYTLYIMQWQMQQNIYWRGIRAPSSSSISIFLLSFLIFVSHPSYCLHCCHLPTISFARKLKIAVVIDSIALQQYDRRGKMGLLRFGRNMIGGILHLAWFIEHRSMVE